MWAGLRGVAVLQAVVVVVLDRLLVLIQGEWPEAIEMDAVAEASGQGVHEEASGGSLDVHLVGQPVPSDGVQQAQGGVGSPDVDAVFQDELIDPLHALLAPLGHEGRDPEDAAVKAVQALQQLLPPRLIHQVLEGSLDDRRVHGHQVCLRPHVLRVLLHGSQVAPDDKAVCVDLGATAAAQQHPRVAYDGTGGELLALEGRGAGQQLIQVLRDVHGAVPVKDVVNDIPRLQRPLQHGNVLLCIQELQDLFPDLQRECLVVSPFG